MSRKLLAATALAVFVVLVATSWPRWSSPFLQEQGDMAANALQTERAREGRELLGPYSQHGFHHPGPASFYCLAALEPLFRLFPSPMARSLAAQLALNLAAFACSMWLLNRAGLSASGAVAGVFLVSSPLLFLGGGNISMLTSFWGPLVVVGPMILFVAALARLADGDLTAAPFAAAGATIAWHTHILTVPPMAAGTILAAVALIRRRPRLTPPPRRRQGVTLCVSALLLIVAGLVPVIIEQSTGSPGNLTLMWRFLRGHESQVHSWSEITRQLGQAFTDPLVVLFPSGAAYLGGVPATLAVVGTLLILSALQFRTSTHAWRLLLALVWTTIATAAVVARRLYGTLDTYLFYYLYGMAGLLYVSLAHGLQKRWPGRLAVDDPRAVVATAIACLLLLTPWLLAHPIAPPTSRDDVATVLAGLALTKAEALHLSLGAGDKDGDLWHLVPTFALRLRRAGVTVTVDERFVVVCGEEMRARTDSPRPDVLLFTRTEPSPESALHVRVDDWGATLVHPIPGPTDAR